MTIVSILLPTTETRRRDCPTTNPIQSPSGEKNGSEAPSVPSIGSARSWSSLLRYRRDSGPPTRSGSTFSQPAYTSRFPSGEIANDVEAGRPKRASTSPPR